jgi:hypothetical protein
VLFRRDVRLSLMCSIRRPARVRDASGRFLPPGSPWRSRPASHAVRQPAAGIRHDGDMQGIRRMSHSAAGRSLEEVAAPTALLAGQAGSAVQPPTVPSVSKEP